MIRQAKNYRNKVVECLIQKYNLSETEAKRAIRISYLNHSLTSYPDETIHDDIEVNADKVYYDYTYSTLQ